jgi:hypothetical protein
LTTRLAFFKFDENIFPTEGESRGIATVVLPFVAYVFDDLLVGHKNSFNSVLSLMSLGSNHKLFRSPYIADT